MTQPVAASVIVPCFNYGHLLGETLESVKRQSFVDWECIVVDDGSTDATGEVARSFSSADARFVVVRQANRGLSAARNAGLRIARGAHVQLLDADDLLEPDKLRRHAEFLDAHPDCALIYGGTRFFRDCGTVRRVARGRHGIDADWMTMWQRTDEAMLLALIEGNQFPVSAALFRRALVDEFGGFDESLRSHEDWDFWLRCALGGRRFCGLDEAGARTLIREHGANMSRQALAMTESRLSVRRRIDKGPLTETLRRRNRRCMTYDECEVGAALIAQGCLRAGANRFFGAFAEAESKAWALRLLVARLAPQWLMGSWHALRRGAARAR